MPTSGNLDINVEVEILDNSPEVLSALDKAIKRALWEMGNRARNYASKNAPWKTGNLSNSITHEEHGNTTYIGTDVEYAAAQELGSSRGIRPKHYLMNAVANHAEEYVQVVKDSMANV